MTAIMTNLPWDVVEEILSRVAPKSLVRFKSVSKEWNALINNKTFVDNHKAKFQFILVTNSKIYSVRIDPIIVVRELNLCTGSLEPRRPKYLVEGDNFVLCGMDNGAAVWNPWFPVQARLIKAKNKDKARGKLECHGICYNPRDKESVINKTIWSYQDSITWRIHDLASHAWKDVKQLHNNGQNDHHEVYGVLSQRGVSLNGSLYWVGISMNRTDGDTCLCHLFKFDFLREKFYKSGDLPCVVNHPSCDALVLRAFHGDRLMLLKQCHITKKIDIWVSKNNGDKVGWEDFMTFSDPNLPSLVQSEYYTQPSYFIDDDERLVVCCCDETGRAWIYVMGQNKLISQTRIESVIDHWPLHCTHIPNLVPVPKKSNTRIRFHDYALY